MENPAENDISFSMFVTSTTISQFVSQRTRVEMWIRQVLLREGVVCFVVMFMKIVLTYH